MLHLWSSVLFLLQPSARICTSQVRPYERFLSGCLVHASVRIITRRGNVATALPNRPICGHH